MRELFKQLDRITAASVAGGTSQLTAKRFSFNPSEFDREV